MAHIKSIGAGVFSDLSISVESLPATYDDTTLKGLFGTELANGGLSKTGNVWGGGATPGEFLRIKNVREYPAMGTPPNVVNVPTYGSKTSQQVQGQSDAPSMEITMNFVGDDWQKGTGAAGYLGNLVGDNIQRVFRFTLLNSEPTGSGATKWASTAAGLGTVENTQFFWVGKIEALVVNPQLTDANTATVTLTVQSSFYGAFTNDNP